MRVTVSPVTGLVTFMTTEPGARVPVKARAADLGVTELTHAVTEYSADLYYYMQSGALNESYSDIFGETVDLTNGAGTDTAGSAGRWGRTCPAVSWPAPPSDKGR